MKLILITLCALLLGTATTSAQQFDREAQIPTDTAYRIGSLDNGMRYYVRHNAQPAGLADFYILTDVGAIQEEDHQNGLAHFLEHMAFNGTTNMPGKAIINYCESIGVRFGANLNAATGQELTRYLMKNVPMTREGIVDTMLLILHDWANCITLDGDEIDAERGVIVEELRRAQTASRRIWDAERAVLFEGTRYVDRNILGTDHGLKTFSYDAIRSFYHKWYNTSHQAIIVVGDFDPDWMVDKIKKAMSDIEPNPDAEPNAVIRIPNNDQPKIAILTDKELTSTSADIYIKHAPFPREFFSSQGSWRDAYMANILSAIVSERAADIQEQEPDIKSMGLNFYGHYNNATAGVRANVSTNTGCVMTGFETLYREMQRLLQHGVTQSEFERAKTRIVAYNENSYLKRSNKTNNSYVSDASDHFLVGYGLPSAEFSRELALKAVESFSHQDLLEFMRSKWTLQNQVIILKVAPDGGALPTEEDIYRTMRSVEAERIAPPADMAVATNLIEDNAGLKAAKVKRNEAGVWGSTCLTLGNGVKVVLMPTDYRANQVMFHAQAAGGRSTLCDSLIVPSRHYASATAKFGIGNFSDKELTKVNAGCDVSRRITCQINNYNSYMYANSSEKDIERMLQMVYLTFTAPRYDTTSFEIYKTQTRNSYLTAKNPAVNEYNKRINSTLYGDHPHRPWLDENNLEQVGMDDIQALHKIFFADAGGYTFYLTGSFKPENVIPLVEQYIGALPCSRRAKRTWKDDKAEYLKGNVLDRFEVAMENPFSRVGYYYWGGVDKVSGLDRVVALAFQHIVGMRYTQIIREQMGGTYSVSTSLSYSHYPSPKYVLNVGFQTAKERVDTLRAVIPQVLEDVATNGVTAEEVSKARAYISKNRPDTKRSNSHWENCLVAYYSEGIDLESGIDQAIEEFSAEDIRALASKMVTDGHNIRFVMDPK